MKRAGRSGDASGFWHRNSLSIVFLALTLLTLAGHVLVGWKYSSGEREAHGETPQALATYAAGGEFLSSLFENWESEFLQMGMFVLLTVSLRQRGSSESRSMDPRNESAPAMPPVNERPWPVRRGGLWLKLYEHSLSMALLSLFTISLGLHWINSWRAHVHEQALHHQPVTPWSAYLWDAQFWFESLQNWQSEFLSVVVLVVLSIFLREKDSSQSKKVYARHSDTGAD